MKPTRSLVLLALACAACARDPVSLPAPVEVHVLEAPVLQVGMPARLLLDLRTGIPTAGVEIAIEGDAGLTVVDYAPKLLPATEPTAGSQVFVDVVPTSGGTSQLIARLVLHVDGERQTRLVTRSLTVTGPETALQAETALQDGG